MTRHQEKPRIHTDYIAMTPDEEHYIEAQRRTVETGVLSGSHRGLDGNQVGCLGEVMFEQYLKDNGVPYTPELDQTSHDFIVGDKQLVMEVKTKDRTVPPKPDYECSVPSYNEDHQNVQAYAFFSLQRRRGSSGDIRRFHTCWFVGVISRSRFDKNSVTRRTGETDPRNQTKFCTACKNIEMSRLYHPQLLVKY